MNSVHIDQDFGTTDTRPRGLEWVEMLAGDIELSDEPVIRLFTGLPGSGKSTELRRLADRLAGHDGARLLPIYVDTLEILDLTNEIDVPDLMMAIVFRAEQEVLKWVEQRDEEDALQESAWARFSHWWQETEVITKGPQLNASGKMAVPGVGEATAGVNLALELKTRPSLRRALRERIQQQLPTFLSEVKDELLAIQARVRGGRSGFDGIVLIVDSLEKLRGTSTNWAEVQQSAERLFAGGAPYLRLPVHTLYTVPPAVALRLNLPDLQFMPMIKLWDRATGAPFQPGIDAATALVRQRIPDEHLRDLLGHEDFEGRRRKLIEWSGGYPRELVRLLQSLVRQRSYDAGTFDRLLEQAGNNLRLTVTSEASFDLLATVARTRQLVFDETARTTVDQLLSNNVILRYQNGDMWFDVHPAVRAMPAVQERLAKPADGG